MSKLTALLSSNWYRVAHLKPRLRGHARIHRHAYRGAIWYVVEDRVAAKYHRFNPAAYRVISLLDGKRSMDLVWQRLTEPLADDTPSQEEVIRLIGQMHESDLIQFDVDPDVAELFERRGKQQKRQLASRYLNPIALRFSLLDPDRFLTHAVAWLKPLAGWRGVLLWLAVVLPALLLAPVYWPDLTRNFSEQLLTFDNILVMLLIFPLIKAAHELAHGLAVKAGGGEVHDMGIMLLVFFPVPYVDASSSSAFPGKYSRMLVGAAGMLAELFIAALAFCVWLLLEPGLVRSLAYNVIILASITTIIFNANPLLRYDGYYILADWIEIPNFGGRANRHWQYLAERYVFGVSQSEPPPSTAAEKRWFLPYAPLAFAYRMFVLIGISLFLAQQYFVLGVLLAIWGAVASIGIPLGRGLVAIFTGPQYAAHAGRVRAVLFGGTALVLLFLFVLPMPYHTPTEGVVWLPEQAVLRARATGFVQSVDATPGAQLVTGTPVLRGYDPTLSANIRSQAARLEEARSRYDAAWGVRPAQAGQLEEEVRREEAALARIREDERNLILRAQAAGALVMEQPNDMPGRFLKKGDVAGYVVGEYQPLVRVVVPQSLVDQVRLSNRAIEIKMPQDMASTWTARLIRAVPKAGRDLPSPALGKGGGGSIAVDPQDTHGLKSLESLFEFELELPAEVPGKHIGSRVYVRFEHAPEPVGWRAWRALRRMFLSQFQV